MIGFKRKIRIVCLVQCRAVIDKVKLMLKIIEKDPKFDLKIIAFPEKITEFPKNKDLSFWKENYGDIVVNAIEDKDHWYDLKKDKPDYVIIQRPYDIYMPEEYSLAKMAEYTKIVYVPYGFSLANIYNITMTKEVMKELSIIIAENDDSHKYYTNLIKKINDDKKRVSLNIGYPIFDDVIKIADREESKFKQIEKKTSINVMYTPRWTSNKRGGGTTFFKYKDKIVDFFKDRDDMQLLFRPHPLAFQNFLQTKEMTKQEIDDYLSNFKNSNMTYDKSDTYLETMKDTDVIVTDFSSVISEFLFFNKPIIFLQSDLELLNNTMRDLCKGFYCCKNFTEIKKTLIDIKNGKDPLKKIRTEKMKKLRRLNDGTVSKRIVEYIKNDYKENNRRFR